MSYEQCECGLITIGKTPEIARDKLISHIGQVIAAGGIRMIRQDLPRQPSQPRRDADTRDEVAGADDAGRRRGHVVKVGEVIPRCRAAEGEAEQACHLVPSGLRGPLRVELRQVTHAHFPCHTARTDDHLPQISQ